MITKGTLDDLYFEWLYQNIAAVTTKNPARSYWKLARQLYTTQFRWHIRNDVNRSEDGKDLRYEFYDDQGLSNVDEEWANQPCSMLEMLIALARKTAFNCDGDPYKCFWMFMETLGLHHYNDKHYNRTIAGEVGAVLECVINRTYSRDGVGGLFPLRSAKMDQRRVEIWYQMGAYLMEGATQN